MKYILIPLAYILTIIMCLILAGLVIAHAPIVLGLIVLITLLGDRADKLDLVMYITSTWIICKWLSFRLFKLTASKSPREFMGHS